MEPDEAIRIHDRRVEFIAGLRELADFYEAHPTLQAPWEGIAYFNLYPEGYFENTREGARLVAKEFSPVKKDYSSETHFVLEKRFSGGVGFDFNFPRDVVCERKQVGTKIVPASEEREVPVYEWECTDPILAPVEEESNA
jgi:hypothetical protein